MCRCLLFGLFFICIEPVAAQSIFILNESDLQPVEGAIIYSDDRSQYVTSDKDGEVNISVFESGSTVVIQHPAYHNLKFTIGKLRESNILLREKIISIDEVVVSANRWEQNKSEIPFEILSLKAKDIAFTNPQTSADMLESTGQVFVQKSQLGGGSPMIRGFGANSVLIVVDGIRMNNAIFRSGNLQNIINIDPNSLESSEVIFGPGTVIYGSDALGGVMDFHTKSPDFATDDSLMFSGQVMARYSSVNNEKTAYAIVKTGRKKFGYVGSISLSNFDDLLTGSVRTKDHPDFGKRQEYILPDNLGDTILSNINENLQRFSGFKQLSTLQKLAFRINDLSELSYTFNFSTSSDIPRYDRLTEYNEEELNYAIWNYGPQKWIMNAIKYNYFKSTELFDAMKLSAAIQLFEESRNDRKYRQAILRNRKERVVVLSLNADLEKQLDIQSELFYGTEYTFNKVNSSAYSRNVITDEISTISTRYPGAGSDVHAMAFYASYKRKLIEQLTLDAGLRFSYQNLCSKFNSNEFAFSSISNTSSAFNGNLGLVFNPNVNWSLSGMISSGYRAPNVDDVSKVFDSEPGNVVVPNPNLQPEYSYNTELSIARNFGDALSINGTIFYSFLKDAMVRGDFLVDGKDSIIYDGGLSKVQAIVNTGRANIYGFNIAMKMRPLRFWYTSINLNYTNGRDLVNNEPLRHTTPVFGSASVNYQRRKLRGEFFLRFNGKRSYAKLPPSERNKPHLYTSEGSLAWYTLNVRGNYQINKVIGVNMTVENILDHHYRTYSSGISAPGRNIVISIRVEL